MIDEFNDEASVVVRDVGCCQGGDEVLRDRLSSDGFEEGLQKRKGNVSVMETDYACVNV